MEESSHIKLAEQPIGPNFVEIVDPYSFVNKYKKRITESINWSKWYFNIDVFYLRLTLERLAVLDLQCVRRADYVFSELNAGI